MSATFATRSTARPPPDAKQIQRLLDENGHLIQTIQEYQSKGKAQEVMQYQTQLHRNLVFLATLADSAQNVNSLLPMIQPPGSSGAPPQQTHGPQPPTTDQQHMNNFNHQQQPPGPAGPYRQQPGPQRPGLPAPHQYPQRGYPQGQYPNQYPPQGQGYPQGQYPPPNQPPGYPAGSPQGNYGQPPTTVAHNNYQQPGGLSEYVMAHRPQAMPHSRETPHQDLTLPLMRHLKANQVNMELLQMVLHTPTALLPKITLLNRDIPHSRVTHRHHQANHNPLSPPYSNQPPAAPQNYAPNNAPMPPFSAPPTNTPSPAVTSAPGPAPPASAAQPYQPQYPPNSQPSNPNAGYTSPPNQGYPPGPAGPPTSYGYPPQPGGYPPQPQYAQQPQGYQYRPPPAQGPPGPPQQGQYAYNYPPQPNPQ
ncbi:hypothetical protein NQ315_015658 [Exocentrus adspersus]|uniref:SS18 N-terminal domain-containing protein n=1 Tax=Exocentrus adspersus TaxID=1586481 RepID=A0AAV8W2K4_9CUCU|nr:hypothetical protein NQ315_015658 [Exocentrus adspersus]